MDFPLVHPLGFVFLTYLASPYQMNPLNYNPFKELLRGAINFERVRQQTIVKLFLCATNVQTAKVKIFRGKDIGLEQLLASTCLPLLMQAVEVDGEYYWDGSYAGNPAIFPLIYDCAAPDILMIHITPAERPGVPTTSPAIMNRMQEISFNTALIREMRTLDHFNRLIDDGRLGGRKRLLVHSIDAEDLIRGISRWSRLNADWDFVTHLRDLGRARAEEWLDVNFERIGIDRRPPAEILLIARSGAAGTPSQSRPELVAHHVAGAAGGGKLLAEFVERGPVIVYNGDDVALRVAHRWQLPKQEDRLTVADQ